MSALATGVVRIEACTHPDPLDAVDVKRRPIRTCSACGERLALPGAPLVKWVGGKSQLLPQLERYLPKTFGRYFEPFAGGAALFFHLARPGSVLGDCNRDLMHAYQMVADDPERVIRRLRWMQTRHQQDPVGCYYEVRDQWNADSAIKALGLKTSGWTAVQRAAAFLYLNRTCWNGVWRVNRAGRFNVPMGRYKAPSICDPERLRAASAALQQAELRIRSWQQTVQDARAGDVVYFDPPYVPRSATSNFTAYTAQGFGPDQHAELAGWTRVLVQQGVTVLVSNSDTRLVRQLYGGLELHRVRMARSINCRAGQRGKVGELLIVGRP